MYHQPEGRVSRATRMLIPGLIQGLILDYMSAQSYIFYLYMNSKEKNMYSNVLHSKYLDLRSCTHCANGSFV